MEKSEEKRKFYGQKFAEQLEQLNLVPAGRVLYGAGSGTQVTYFNCFVMPFVKDSRAGIAEHRKEVMEIMSRGGGVGTNGSTLRPKGAPAKGVGGKSSGAVSWLNDIAKTGRGSFILYCCGLAPKKEVWSAVPPQWLPSGFPARQIR